MKLIIRLSGGHARAPKQLAIAALPRQRGGAFRCLSRLLKLALLPLKQAQAMEDAGDSRLIAELFADRQTFFVIPERLLKAPSKR